MRTLLSPAGLLLAAAIVQRLLELRVAARNGRRLLALGAREVGRDHYPWMIALHGAFFASILCEVLLGARSPSWWAVPFVVFLLGQVLRYWCIQSLGGRWTTRVYVLPTAPLVQKGPYRFLRHPNYLAVAVELAALPLTLGAYVTACVFTLLNALMLLCVRIPAEEAALGPLRHR